MKVYKLCVEYGYLLRTPACIRTLKGVPRQVLIIVTDSIQHHHHSDNTTRITHKDYIT
jgi:hypothetical protein